MGRNELVKKAIQNFFVIFACIILVLTILRQLYYPDMVFDLKSIYIIMAFSFVSVLVGLILHPLHNLSEKSARMRIAVHLIALEIILISLAAIFGIAATASSIVILALEIAGIYAVVRLLSWHNDKRVAGQINEGLKAFQKDGGR